MRPFYTLGESDSLVLDVSFHRSRGYRVREALNPLKQHSALVSLIAERYNAWRLGRRSRARSAAEAARKSTPEESLMTRTPNSQYLANYQLVKRVIESAAQTCRGHAQFILMSVPLVYEDAEIARLRALDASFDPDYFDRDLSALADSSGFTLVPLTEAFSARRRETRGPLHWAHWNYAGHRLVGEVLAEAIGGTGIVPQGVE
jgi:hypothetical protein